MGVLPPLREGIQVDWYVQHPGQVWNEQDWGDGGQSRDEGPGRAAVMLVGKTDFGMRVKNSVHGEDKTGTHSQTVY